MESFTGWSNHVFVAILWKYARLVVIQEDNIEENLDPDDSIALNPNEIPIVTFRQRISKKLGRPYNECRKSKPSGLRNFSKILEIFLKMKIFEIKKSHFDHYTKKQCMFQCLINYTESICKCASPLFPKNLNATERLKTCGFIEQVIYVLIQIG